MFNFRFSNKYNEIPGVTRTSVFGTLSCDIALFNLNLKLQKIKFSFQIKYKVTPRKLILRLMAMLMAAERAFIRITWWDLPGPAKQGNADRCY